MTTEPDSEPKYKTKRLVQNGVIKYAHVPYSTEDENQDLKKQIENPKALCDNQRKQIELLEEKCKLYKEIEKARDNDEPVSTFKMYS